LRNESEILAEIEIRATPERVWMILVDFPSYPDWNPMIRSIEGVARRSERLRISIQPQGGLAMTLHPKLLEVAPNRELRWRGGLAIPGMLEGEHFFLIAPLSAEDVRLTQGERFSGLLFRLFPRRFRRVTLAGFEAVNKALKQRAERGS